MKMRIQASHGWKELEVYAAGWIVAEMTVMLLLLLQLPHWKHSETILVKDGLKVIKIISISILGQDICDNGK